LATRWKAENQLEKLRLYMVFLLTQRGSVCLYQGEELGLTEAELTFGQLVDPAGITFWPAYKGRDGCRTPHPWQADAKQAGFSTTTPWLPVPRSHLALSVDQQERDADSLLNAYRDFLAFRRCQAPLVKGDITYHPVRASVMCFERDYQQTRLLIALNFSDQPASLNAPSGSEALADVPQWISGEWRNGQLSLPPYGIGIARCDATAEEASWVV
ncbi:MAG: alpha-glucosidase C-terminal domain-containing protein, partial [Halomonas sp.]